MSDNFINKDHTVTERSRREHTQAALDELNGKKGENYRIIKQLYTFSSYSAVFEILSADGTPLIVKAIDCGENEMAFPPPEDRNNKAHEKAVQRSYIKNTAENELAMLKKLLLCQYTVPLISYYEYKTADEDLLLFFFPRYITAEEYFARNGFEPVMLAKLMHDVSRALEELHKNRTVHAGICSDHIYYSEKDDRFLLGDMACEGRYKALRNGVYTSVNNSLTRFPNRSSEVFPSAVPDYKYGFDVKKMSADIYMLGVLAGLLEQKYNTDGIRCGELDSIIRKCCNNSPAERYTAAELSEATGKFISACSGGDAADNKPSVMRCIEYFSAGRLDDAVKEAEKGSSAEMINMKFMRDWLLSCKYSNIADKEERTKKLREAANEISRLACIKNRNNEPLYPAAGLIYALILLTLIKTDSHSEEGKKEIESSAFLYLRKSADCGFPPAQHLLGTMKLIGLRETESKNSGGTEGLDLDNRRGRDYLIKAQASLYPPAAYCLKDKEPGSELINLNDIDEDLLMTYRQNEEPVYLLRALAWWK